MGRITDISVQKRNRSRVNVFIDGEFVCGLDAVAAASARLAVGDEMTAERLRDVVHDSELNSAFERAADRLASSPRSRKEISRYLAEKGYERDIIEETLKKLEAYRYIDDRSYAEAFIRAKSKKYGNVRLAAELRQNGVASDIISELIEDAGEQSVTDVARKYLKAHAGCDVNKLKRFLAGRGFSWDGISQALSELEENGEFDTD